MEFDRIQQILREKGVCGAGGAGFPSYAKLNKNADTIVLNCAECEPLLKLHRQLLEQKSAEILTALHEIGAACEVSRIVIGLKPSYKRTIEAVEQVLPSYPEMEIHFLKEVYPAGDEVVLVYETTGRVVRPGGLPIEAGVIVFNVETMYNAYQALMHDKGVTDKLVSVVAEVKHPCTMRLPLGTTFAEAVELAGGAAVDDPVYFVGGPMMGNIREGSGRITKTCNAILVLPKDHPLVMKKKRNVSIDLKRAASACCQCHTCTDLCPRHALGHPIDPAGFMRSAANGDFQDLHPFLDTFFCSQCGLCELFSCPQDLAPRSIIGVYKNGLRAKGVKAPAAPAVRPVSSGRELRQVPQMRLRARLGLEKYNVDAPLDNSAVPVEYVEIPLSQHIGAPAKPVVKAGDAVSAGTLIAAPADGLSVGIHASVSGTIEKVTDSFIAIRSSIKTAAHGSDTEKNGAERRDKA